MSKRTQPPRLPPFFEKSAEAGDLCVSTPGQRALYHHLVSTQPQQGGSDPFSSHCLTKTLLIGCDIRRGRSLNVPAEFSTRCHPTLPLFDSWFFMLPPQKQVSQPLSAAAFCRSQGKQPLFKHLQFARTFRHAVPPPSFPSW